VNDIVDASDSTEMDSIGVKSTAVHQKGRQGHQPWLDLLEVLVDKPGDTRLEIAVPLRVVSDVGRSEEVGSLLVLFCDLPVKKVEW